MKTIFLVQKVNYNITEIVDEKVPLSGGTDSQNYASIVLLIVTMIVLAVIAYIVRCFQHRMRVRMLGGECKGFSGWNLWQLKHKISELEIQRTEDMMVEMIFL